MDIRKVHIILVCIVCFTLTSSKLPGQGGESEREKIDYLVSQYDRPNQPGVAVSVIRKSEILYSKGVGEANLEYGIEINPSTVFHVASVSKQFTAFCIMLLQADGLLSLDDDVRKYIPELKVKTELITLRHLASHTSGLREIFDLIQMKGIALEDLLTNDEALEIILRQENLNFEPGTQYSYCNSGYILLAEVVKRITGKSFALFAKERIFEPLQMKNTRFKDDATMIIENKAYSYYPTQDGFRKSLLNFSLVGSTGLNTTTEDLCKWADNFSTLLIGSKAIFEEMERPNFLESGKRLPYGLGEETKIYRGLEVVFHGGGDAGYRAYLLRCPDLDFAVVVLGNDQSFNPLDLAYGILDVFLKEEMDEAPNETDIPILEASTLQKYVGKYQVFPGLFLDFIARGDSLFLKTSGSEDLLYVPYQGDHAFVFPYLPHSKLVFSSDEEGKFQEVSWHFSDFAYPGKRVVFNTFDKRQIDFTEFEGLFYSSELETSYRFEVDEAGTLTANHHKIGRFAYEAVQNDFFISNYGFVGGLAFLRDEKGKIIGCHISGQDAHKVFFKKQVCGQ
jgi:CubicO group peptidase (beta-lactamase class C family)